MRAGPPAPTGATAGAGKGIRIAAAAAAAGVVAAAVLIGALVHNPGPPPGVPATSPTGDAGAPSATAQPGTGHVPTMRNVVPPVPVIGSAVELGPIQQHDRVDGRDNGQSTRYGNRSVWLFADTVLRSPWGFLSNSGASTSDLHAGDGITLRASDVFGRSGIAPVEMMPRTPAEQAFENAHAKSTGCTALTDPYCDVRFGFWPGPVIADPARHRVLVFYNKLCRGGVEGTPCSGPMGLAIGSGVAALDMTTHRVTRLTASNMLAITSVEGSDPTMFFPSTTGYAAAALAVGGDAYVYGVCTVVCHLARVPLDHLTDRSRWAYYAGRDMAGRARWSPDQGQAVDTIAAGAAGGSVFWDPALDGWLNVYMPYGSSTLMAQIGGSPYGPWSPEFPLLATDTAGWGTNYAAFGHPEYAERGGLVEYVTYFQTTTGEQHLVRITFGR